MSKLVSFALRLPNQDIRALKNTSLEFVAHTYLPKLLTTWNAIEQVTGYRWKPTSYIRQSPNHQYGIALDLAPDISASSESSYAVHSRLNPFLYKRGILLKKLQRVIPLLPRFRDYENPMIVVECDHLHIQLMAGPPSLIKWKVIKPIYKDSEALHDAPMFN